MVSFPCSSSSAFSLPLPRSARRECALVLRLVSRYSGVARADILSSQRRPMPISRARQLAMYLCHVVLGLSMTHVGLAFGRDRTTVAHACAQIEDSREDPGIDASLQALEDAIQKARMTARRVSSGEAVAEIHHAR